MTCHVCTDNDCTTYLSGVVLADSAGVHVCALLFTGNAQCWGWNFYGKLGIGSVGGTMHYPSAYVLDPTGLGPLTGVISAGATYWSTCFGANHSGFLGVYCVGRNAAGELGNPSYPTGSSIVVP